MSWRFDAIGTPWEIETETPLTADQRARVTAIVDRFDQEWSRFRSDSVVSALRDGGTAVAPPDAVPMIDAYRRLSRATRGAVNPLVGAGLEAIGYDRAVSLQHGHPESAPADWERMLSVCLHGPMLGLRAVLPGMVERSYGRVVCLASDSARIGQARLSYYAAAKAGVIALVKSVAQEVGKSGVTLNVVSPGATNTPLRLRRE